MKHGNSGIVTAKQLRLLQWGTSSPYLLAGRFAIMQMNQLIWIYPDIGSRAASGIS